MTVNELIAEKILPATETLIKKVEELEQKQKKIRKRNKILLANDEFTSLSTSGYYFLQRIFQTIYLLVISIILGIWVFKFLKVNWWEFFEEEE